MRMDVVRWKNSKWIRRDQLTRRQKLYLAITWGQTLSAGRLQGIGKRAMILFRSESLHHSQSRNRKECGERQPRLRTRAFLQHNWNK